MRKIFNLLFVLLIVKIGYSQNFIERQYTSLINDENSTRVVVSGKLFEYAATFVKGSEEPESKEIGELIGQVKGFDLISSKVSDPRSEFTKGMKALNGFDELIRVKSEDNNVAILIKESNDIIHELVGLIANKDEFVAFTLEGKFNMNQITELAKKIEGDELKSISRSLNFGDDNIKVYPNPINKNGTISLEIPQKFDGGTVSLVDNTGKIVLTQNISGEKMELATKGITNGSYTVKIANSTTTVNKKVVIVE